MSTELTAAARRMPRGTQVRALVVGACAAFVLAACGSGDDMSGMDHSTMDHSTMSMSSTASPSTHDHSTHSHGPSSSVVSDPTEVTGSAAPAAGHTQADVDFVQMMIPHHQQALVMSDLVPMRSQNAQLKDLAKRIIGTQQPEITQMQGALAEWGVEQMPSDAHRAHAMPGMMTAEQMKHLAGLQGAAFDKEWVTMMIAHHEGAVGMARTELAQGKHGPTRDLATHVIDAQQKEIDEMKAMLKG